MMKKVTFLITMILTLTLATGIVFGKGESLSAAGNDTIMIQDFSGAKGEKVVVNLMLNNPKNGVDAFTLDFNYDTSMLKFEGCDRGSLDPKWVMFNCNEKAPGLVTIGAFALDKNSIATGSNGDMAKLTFTVTCDGCAADATSKVTISRKADDIADFQTKEAIFTVK